MDKGFTKDIVLLAKYLRRLGVKYPEAYITGNTLHDIATADVTYYEHEPKNYDGFHYSHCRIDEKGKIRFY